MNKTSFFIVLICLIIGFSACDRAAVPAPNDNIKKTVGPEIIYNFDNSNEGWQSGVVEIGSEQPQTEFAYTDIPVAGQQSKGLMLMANNSDAMFMYTYIKLADNEEIIDNTNYTVDLSFDIATNVPKGAGEADNEVFVKGGIITNDQRISSISNVQQFYIEQGSLGKDNHQLKALGTVEKVNGNSQDTTYQYKRFDNTFDITTTSTGDIFVVLGVESGQEGVTQIYFDNVKVKFTKK